MNRKETRNGILCIIVIMISLLSPFLIVKRQDTQALAGSYPFYKRIQTEESRRQMPELVKSIQKRYETEKYEVTCGDDGYGHEHIWEKKQGKLVAKEFPFIQICELIKRKIVGEKFLGRLTKQEAIIVRKWDYVGKTFSYSNMKIFLAEDNFSMAIGSGEWEPKAKKFIKIKLKKEYLGSALSKEELLYQYVKYLQLDQVGDWEYKKESLQWEQGGVAVKVVQEGDYASLGIYLLS